MDESELVGRIVRTLVFGGMTLIGLAMIYGLHSRVLLLALVIATCMVFSTLTMFAMAASLTTFAAGVALWAGLIPAGLDLPGWLREANPTAVRIARPDTTVADAGASSSLSDRLQQLSAACAKGLLSEPECKTMRAELLDKFRASQ